MNPAQATAIARIIVDEVPRQGGSIHLTPQVLALLVLLDGNPMSMGEIRAALGMAQALAAELVAEAVELGLVDRLPRCQPKPRGGSSHLRGYGNGHDARIALVALTPKAQRLRKLRRGGA